MTVAEMLYRLGRWVFSFFGLVPAVEARRDAKFEETLQMLLPSEQDREQFKEGVIWLAQAGLGAGDMAKAARMFARGYGYEQERETE